MNWETILFFGDSLTFGARSYLGYPEYVGDILRKELNKSWHVINHATNGFTAIDLSRSISKQFSDLKEANALVSVILIGTNDAKGGTEAEDYRIALEQVIVKAKLLTMNNNIFLLEIPSFPKGVMYPYTTKMNREVELYNQVIADLCTRHRLSKVEVPLEEEHLYDGVHFNKKGSLHFAEYLAAEILKDRGM